MLPEMSKTTDVGSGTFGPPAILIDASAVNGLSAAHVNLWRRELAGGGLTETNGPPVVCTSVKFIDNTSELDRIRLQRTTRNSAERVVNSPPVGKPTGPHNALFNDCPRATWNYRRRRASLFRR